MDGEFLDIPAAAKELGLSESQIWRLIRRSAIPRHTLPHGGKRTYIHWNDLPTLRRPAAPSPVLPPTRHHVRPRPDRSERTMPVVYTKEVNRSKSVVDQQSRMGIALDAQEKFRSLLRQLRIESGIAQTTLSRRLGQQRTFVSKYELGQRYLDVLELRRICQELGLPLTEFIQRLEAELDNAAPNSPGNDAHPGA